MWSNIKYLFRADPTLSRPLEKKIPQLLSVASSQVLITLDMPHNEVAAAAVAARFLGSAPFGIGCGRASSIIVWLDGGPATPCLATSRHSKS